MIGRARLLGLAMAASLHACDGPEARCATRADCAHDEHCLWSPDRGVGECIAAPGYDDPPPLEVFTGPPVAPVLFVVDDGPGSAHAQDRLIAALPALVDGASRRGTRLRVAATSASVARPGCDSRAFARSGRFASTSCLDRLGDFVADDGTNDSWVCWTNCSLTTDELPIDPERPWIDLDAFADPAEAAAVLACVVPQGTSGCSRGSPLYAAWLAMLRAAREDEPEFGAFAETLQAQIVVVTDGMDCSVSDAGLAAFDPAGDRALWPDPDAEIATEAVCWAAGVACTGLGPVYDDCEPIDRDVEGEAPTPGSPSVLIPMSAFEWLALGLAELHVIAGLPLSDPPVYTTEGDPEYVATHGIGPGCRDGLITAAPALRLQEIPYSEQHSICEPDYDFALAGAAGQASPNLYVPACAIPALRVRWQPVGDPEREIPTCLGDDPQLEIPVGAPACWAWRLDGEPYHDHGLAELVLRTRAPQQRDRFTVTPNPWSPATVIDGCLPWR